MSKHNDYIYRKSSENIIETLKIAIKRKSVEREVFKPRRVNTLSPPIVMDTEEIFDLIPPFSPSSPNNLSAEEWIEAIEDIKVIYGWDDRLTLVYASLRLENAAKRWFKENSCDWSEFKIKFIRRFSNRISKTEHLEELQYRRKEYNESYENYVYDIERTALKCGCSVEKTINYIISGLRDSYLRTQLIALNCKTVDAVLARIKKITGGHMDNEDLRNHIGRSGNGIPRESTEAHNISPQKVCGKWKKFGHYASECWSKITIVNEREGRRLDQASKESMIKRAVMCVKCKKYGHYSSDCYLNDAFCHYCKRKGHKSYDCRLKEDNEIHEERNDQHCVENFRHDTGINTKVFCVKCNQEGHHTRDCNLNSNFNEAFCHNCKRNGHKSYECRLQVDKDLHEERSDCRSKMGLVNERVGPRLNQPSKESVPKRTVLCVKCKKFGHYASDCFFKEAFCHDCKCKGHTSYDCRLKVDEKFREEIRDERNSEFFSQNTNIKNEVYCWKCKIGGHNTRDCNFKEMVYYEKDQISKDSNVKVKVFKKFRDDKRNESNHSFEEYARRGPPFCWKCRIKGHYTEECKFNVKIDRNLKEYPLENKEQSLKETKEKVRTAIEDAKQIYNKGRQSPIYSSLNNDSKRRIESITNKPPAKKIILSEKQIEQNWLECRPTGHLGFEYQLNSHVATNYSPKESLITSIKPSRNLSELLKPVRIDNIYVTGLVNLGSDCTTLQKSEFDKHNWTLQPCNLELNGFGYSLSTTIGKISKNVCIGEVELLIDILVVDDSIQDFPLVLGSNFLDHPSVCVVKKYRSLEIKLVDIKPPIIPALPPGPTLAIEEPLKIKTEPGLDMEEENHLIELLEIIKQDCS